ncbi:MAG: class I SAM-dependent methyltransferase [Hyphomonas sp.]
MQEQDAKQAWLEILTQGRDADPVKAVLEELSEFSGLPIAEVEQIAANSNRITGEKWAQADRSTPEGMRAFYASVSNWVFGTLNYHAKQALLDHAPLPAIVAGELDGVPPGEFLDFGAGVGTACLLFDRIGWRVTAADVSPPLMEFAAWRFRKHGANIPIIDLNAQDLEPGKYDVIAGFNTMAHIVDVRPTIEKLWRALKPGGLLMFDIDSRSKDQQMYWHVLESHYPFLRVMRSAGFEFVRQRDGIYVYRRVERTPLGRFVWQLRDGVRYGPAVQIMANLKNRISARLRG